MSDTNTETPASPQPLQSILRRIAPPLLLFSAVLFGLLLLSYSFVLPRFTRLHKADGAALSPRAIARYEKTLAASLLEQEEERVRLVLPVNNGAYAALKEEKRAFSLLELEEQLVQTAARLGEPAGTVSIARLSLEGDAVHMEGDVRNVDTRSMTVLAAYVEELQELPFVADLQRPVFTREQLPDGGFRSPFVIRFTLKPL